MKTYNSLVHFSITFLTCSYIFRYNFSYVTRLRDLPPYSQAVSFHSLGKYQ